MHRLAGRPSARFFFRALGAVTLAAVAITTASASGPVFANSLVPLYADAQGSVVLGTISPGTPLQTSGGGARSAVTLDGWSPDGAESVVDAAVGQRVVLATMSAPAIAHRNVLDQTTDAYGSKWSHVQFTGYVDATHLVPNVDTVWQSAKQLYSTRCSACHSLHSPSEFTANQWPGILQVMGKNAALDPSQAALITHYLQAHARPQ